MRILELEIKEVRGIRHLLVKPQGKNFAIWGPNGSGKSAVVDAIDFLLTGRVSRLMGRGTSGISLSQHGPHVDHRPEEATVRAIVQLPGLADPVEIMRCMAQPNLLEFDRKIEKQVTPLLELAARGQHVLSRREILKYITSEPSTRAEEIQALLNISEIEDVRKSLVKVLNDADRELQAERRNLEAGKAAVNSTTQGTAFDEASVLQVVNQNRVVLGAKPIKQLNSAKLKVDLILPKSVSGAQSINVTLLEKDISTLLKLRSLEEQDDITAKDVKLRRLLVSIRSNPDLLRDLSRLQLTDIGISLIDDTGSCPLCDTRWPPGKLYDFLRERLAKARVASQNQKEIEKLSNEIISKVNTASSSLEKVVASAQLAGFSDKFHVLEHWAEKLRDLKNALSEPISKYVNPQHEPSTTGQLMAPDGIEQALEELLRLMKSKYPETTPEQNAWDTLTRLEENLKVLESAQDACYKATTYHSRAQVLHDTFHEARDNVLAQLYDEISNRFAELYRQIHGSDEEQFKAKIQPDGAGISFHVDFYGRGAHPPHALHSEGHQDSMGLCIYLALAERLTQGLIDLIILDDVVMSVDSNHRRQVCTLLRTAFPSRQFLITTHDKTWANQLKSEGLVTSGSTIEFYNWNIETGPRVNYEADLWEQIDKYLATGDVPSAAALLRRGSEEFFAYVCDALEAPVRFRLDARNDLGDFLSAATGRYGNLLRQAKKAAQSWADTETMDRLNELDSTIGPIYSRTYAEQWAVNANVHFNNWANFAAADFRPVVEAFLDLRALFACSRCGAVLRLLKHDMAPAAIRCNCGNVNWNLTEKKATDPSFGTIGISG